ncbi:ABC transporter substrate-binding protein [Tessaracoccus sp.]|uniref:ABC transporter substrate-binding protein n=1 Tax=Tessaracoccus sp. TaxID=1971211 RepID=UPI002627AC0F|nr:sugar ABC transporter substrate-binding protein [Tessaracoccus sp.]
MSYWLWDAAQLPAYQQCADDFAKANEGVTVKITQTGWGDYWGKVTNGMAAGTAPDVFADHLAKYPDFVKTKQLAEISEDGVDMAGFADGLADLWVGQDGKRYGLPKDWDTVALFYNKDMVKEAGISDDEMANMTWNPQDGGSFEKAVAKLTVDKNGKRGDEAGFDKNNVAVYGLGLPASGAGVGQTEWFWFVGSTGWRHTDTNPWGSKYNFDDPRFQDSIAWWAGLIEKGYMPKLETTVGASMNDNFGASKTAINANGSWMINTYFGYNGINVGLAPTPEGPEGRVSMFNGLADSIWAGSKNQENAAKWVKYMASPACQDVVGEMGVVFPALKSGTEKASAAFKAKDIDVSSFTVHVDNGSTALFPITENAAKIEGVMKPAMDAVLAGSAPASSLTAANEQVNALFN